jgi:hypothetical protein
MHGARPALRHAAAELGSDQPEVLAQHPQQRFGWIDIHLPGCAVDLERESGHSILPESAAPTLEENCALVVRLGPPCAREDNNLR